MNLTPTGFRRRSGHDRHVCIVVQNLPVPFDRRVWLECRALHRRPATRSRWSARRARATPPTRSSTASSCSSTGRSRRSRGRSMFLAEYAWSILATLVALARAWRRRRFDVVQVCNPPDVLWRAVLPFRLVFGVRMVFDQHDLCPELYESRFPDSARLPYRALLLTERATYGSRVHVIATNESYRRSPCGAAASGRTDVTIVRTGPDPDRMRRGRAGSGAAPWARAPARLHRRDGSAGRRGRGAARDAPHRARPRPHRRRAHADRRRRRRPDAARACRGAGPRPSTSSSPGAHRTNWSRGCISTADIGLSPDPKNPLNDVSTMNKTMEYMAFELPVVAFDLVETRVSAQDAAVYATPDEVDEYGDARADTARRRGPAQADG